MDQPTEPPSGDDPTPNSTPGSTAPVDLHASGPLTRGAASSLLARGAMLLESGDFAEALATYQRVVGFDDPEVTAAGFLGMAQARYRLDDEEAAIRTWEAILELPETSATYHAWRNVAAARVRDGDLNGAIAAYREADRRAPAADKPEIANRLGWLAKETGNVRASRRYFARGRGSMMPLASYAILGLTIAVSLTAMFAQDGGAIYDLLALDKVKVAAGEVWRLWTVTLLHDQSNVLHLLFNMYGLYLAGPIVERLYGARLTVAFYLVCALGGSLGSFAFGDARYGVGASGAIYDLLALDKVAVAAGEVWRLWTVTLLHDQANVLHLLFNMYGLYLAGPIVERLYGARLMVAFYVVCALGGSLGSFAFGDARYGVGASGAIFGLFGILLIATRTHNPALDRASRNFVAQLGTLIMINVIFGIIAAGYIDNFAHAGGFIAGALLGLAFVPGKVATIRSMWQPGAGGVSATGFIGSPAGRMAAILVLVGLLAVAAAIGLGRW